MQEDDSLADDFVAEDDFIPDPVQPGGKRVNPYRLLDVAKQVIGNTRIAPFGPQLKEYPAAIAQGLNVAGFGAPEFMSQKFLGKSLPQAETLPGKVLQGVAQGAGFIGGGPVQVVGKGIQKAAMMAAPKLARAGLGRIALQGVKGAAELGSTAAFTPEDIPERAALGGVLGGAGGALGEGISVGKRFFFPKQTGLIPSEAVINRMPFTRRQRFFELQQSRVKSSEARQLEPLVRQQELGLVESGARGVQAQQRLATSQTSRIAQLDRQQAQLEQQLFETSKGRTVQAREPFLKLARQKSNEYKQLVEEGLEASGDVNVTARELFDEFSTRFAQQPGVAESFLSRLGIDLSKGTIPQQSFTARQVLDRIDDIGSTISRQKGSVTRTYSAQDARADDARGILLDVLDKKGVSAIRLAKSRWRDWAQTRDRGIRILRPFDDARFPSETGARVLTQAARGKGNIEVVQDLERAIKQPLTADLKHMVNQLDEVQTQRLLSEVQSKAQSQQIASTQSRAAEDVRRRFLAKSEPLKQQTSERVSSLEKKKFLFDQRAEKGKRILQGATAVGAVGLGLDGLRRIIRIIMGN